MVQDSLTIECHPTRNIQREYTGVYLAHFELLHIDHFGSAFAPGDRRMVSITRYTRVNKDKRSGKRSGVLQAAEKSHLKPTFDLCDKSSVKLPQARWKEASFAEQSPNHRRAFSTLSNVSLRSGRGGL